MRDNAANHRQRKAERGTSGAFCCPSAFALLDDFYSTALPILFTSLENQIYVTLPITSETGAVPQNLLSLLLSLQSPKRKTSFSGTTLASIEIENSLSLLLSGTSSSFSGFPFRITTPSFIDTVSLPTAATRFTYGMFRSFGYKNTITSPTLGC